MSTQNIELIGIDSNKDSAKRYYLTGSFDAAFWFSNLFKGHVKRGFGFWLIIIY